MTKKAQILAISGSTRSNSSNHRLIKAIARLSEDDMEIRLYEGIAVLPHFDPDITDDNLPQPVTDFKRQLREADGVIICTPEYAHGVPGSLKNALDWTVSSGEFSHKPTILVTASTDGRYGHNALLETLRVIEAENIDNLNLLVQFVRTKVSGDNTITDEKTLTHLQQLLAIFRQTLAKDKIDR